MSTIFLKVNLAIMIKNTIKSMGVHRRIKFNGGKMPKKIHEDIGIVEIVEGVQMFVPKSYGEKNVQRAIDLGVKKWLSENKKEGKVIKNEENEG